MKNLVNLANTLTTENDTRITFRNAAIERSKYGPTKKVREERDHTDRDHSRRNARGEKRRQW